MNEEQKVKVGDGITLNLYSDRHACTIIEVSKSGKTIKYQRDKATLLNPEDKVTHVGGFAGHTEPFNQKYAYEADPKAPVLSARWNEKKGGWFSRNQSEKKLTIGRHEYYDYNF